MEIEDSSHHQQQNRTSYKRARATSNGKVNHQDEEEDDAEAKGEVNNNIVGITAIADTRMRPWQHPSSRIFRVSRASGGKDRHSKVYTSKGLRDRRVRLSVSTAIQFYDLQDRLGYDQPSKAIEWLIKAAEPAIAKLPSLESTFPEINMEKAIPSDSGLDQLQQHSSASETSKGSVLSLSRCENRVKARERARERAKDKEKDRNDLHLAVSHFQNNVDAASLNSQGSFTKLLTGASGSNNASSSTNFIQKQQQVHDTADYFSTQSSLFGQHQQQQKATTTHHHQIPSGFNSQQQTHFVNSNNNSPIAMVPFNNAAENSNNPTGVEMQQQFAFLQDHFFPVAATDLNFSISSGLAGFHRGTLQSNSPSHHHHHHHHHHQLPSHHHHHQVQAQRLSASLDGSNVPFFFGAAAAPASSPSENPYSAGFDGHLQLCDGYKHLELKGKGKS